MTKQLFFNLAVVGAVIAILAFAPFATAAPITPASYSYSTAPDAHGSQYLDDTGGQLTDGATVSVGVSPTPGDASVGWQVATSTDITFDLGGTFDLNSVTIGHVGMASWSKWAPDDVTVTFSTDGATFGSPVSSSGFTLFSGSTAYVRDDLTLTTPVTASHVKVAFDGGCKDGGATSNGYLLDEIAFDSTAAMIVLTNPDFNTSLTGWTDVNGSGTDDNYQQTLSGLTSGTLNQKSGGGNYVQQGFNSSSEGPVDASTFGLYTLDFDYGYRRDGATNGDIDLRFALWNTTENTELAFAIHTIPDPGSTGTNSLTAGSVNLNYDSSAAGFVGDTIALRITNTHADLGSGNSWQATGMVDNLVLTGVPEPSTFSLVALGLLGLLGTRRRRKR